MAQCPSVVELLQAVKSLTRENDGTFQTAWTSSFPDPYHCCEQGGFIYVDFPVPQKITRVWIARAAKGDSMNQRTEGPNAAIDLNHPGIKMDNVILVANFHTHPLTSAEPVRGDQKPSRPDMINSYGRGIPGIVISREGIYGYGPERRLNLQNPKVYPPDGFPVPGELKWTSQTNAPPPWVVKNQWPEGTGDAGYDTDGYVINVEWANEKSYGKILSDSGGSPSRKRLFVFSDGSGQDGMLAPKGPTEYLDFAQAFQYGLQQALVVGAGGLPGAGTQYVTNVLRLSRAVKRYSNDNPDDPNRMRQIVFYQSGVGSEADFKGDIGSTSLLLQASGWAVASKIRDAYAFLAQNFEPNDEIFVFGFSRGAYAVRKLVQLMDKIGLLETESLGLFFALWRDLVDGKVPVVPATTRKVKIKCLGVWDTVGAVEGTPATLHLTDSVVPSIVDNAFHALSIQENRHEFRPTFFTLAANSKQNLKECWFPGAHSDVGGGYERHELADISLFWMTGEIMALSLFNLDEAFIDRSKQPAPRDDWGSSQPHNAYDETNWWLRQFHQINVESRLESGDITSTIKFHESWKYAPDPKESNHMVTRKQLEDKFGQLKYQPLNEWEAKRKDHWKDALNGPPIVYDDLGLLFPMYPDRWLTLSEWPKGLIATAFGKEPGSNGANTHVGNVSYKGHVYPGKVLSDCTTIYIVSADRTQEIQIKSGVKNLVTPRKTVAWFRVQGVLTHEKLGGQIPVKAGGDDKGNPRYSAVAFYDKALLGGEVQVGGNAWLPYCGRIIPSSDYNVLVYRTPLYYFHNAAGEYATANTWDSITAGSINSAMIPIAPTEVTTPFVLVALSKIDMDHNPGKDYMVRVKAYADSISTTQFRAHVDTWSTSTLYNGSLSWLKLSYGNPDFRSGVFHCTQPSSTTIDFNWCFDEPPVVFVGLCGFDIGAAKVTSTSPATYTNWQIKVYASDESRTGFKIHVEQPGTTKSFYNCWVTWVAYPLPRGGIDIGAFGGNQLTSSGYSGRAYCPSWFTKPPMVFTAITSFNIPNDDNLRLAIHTEATAQHIDWKIETWAGSRLQEVQVKYIALDLDAPSGEEYLSHK
ncbi:hypothetical protein DFH06DRAFT_1169338 [Mycena polygramma]|nr:hypothetical protein DFH06DRAFT_1169338 [Mycena polygramma]